MASPTGVSVSGVGDASRITQGIVSALSKHLSGLSIDQNLSSIGGQDIASLLRNVLQLSGKDGALNEKDEVLKWTKFADDFLTDAEARNASLKYLNDHLSQRAVLLGDGLKTSEADIVVFSALYSFVVLVHRKIKEPLQVVLSLPATRSVTAKIKARA